jgi:hypothetical protein
MGKTNIKVSRERRSPGIFAQSKSNEITNSSDRGAGNISD